MIEREKFSLWDSKTYQNIKDNVSKTNEYIWKKFSNPLLKWVIFISFWVILMKKIYQMQWFLIVYDSTLAAQVITYWLVLGVLLLILWDAIFDAFQWIITRYLWK